MEIDNRTVGELVAENYKTADVFKKYNIDFCCGGKVSVEEICEKKNVDFEKLKEDIQNIENQSGRTFDFNSWDLDFLIDYIVNTHHKYVSENIPVILQYSNKVAKVHGHHYIETVQINDLFYKVVQELTQHMKKEEIILFPYVKQLVEAKKNNTLLMPPHFGTVENPIAMMESEHEFAGDALKEISELSNNYTPPEEACNTYRVLYSKLKEFEEDLHQHVHLENNILFPKAIELEKSLSNN